MEIFVSRAGRETGPFTKNQISSMHEAGMIGAEDQAWHEGMSEWTSVGTLLQVSPAPPKSARGVAVAPEKIRYRKPGEKTFRRPDPLPSATAAYVIPDMKDRSGQFAGFGLRAAAHAIDAVVLWVIFLILRLLLGDDLLNALFAAPLGQKDTETLVLFFAILLIPGWLYYGVTESSEKQATLGKMVCGLVVTNAEGKRLSFGHASARFFGMILSSCVFGFGFFMCIWTERKQCLHDLVSGCFVLRK